MSPSLAAHWPIAACLKTVTEMVTGRTDFILVNEHRTVTLNGGVIPAGGIKGALLAYYWAPEFGGPAGCWGASPEPLTKC